MDRNGGKTSVPLSDKPVPRGVLIAAGIAMAVTILLAFGAQNGVVPKAEVKLGATAQSRDLVFRDTETGGVRVIDAETGDTAFTVPPREDHFLRVVMREMLRERQLLGGDPQAPFRLSTTETGLLVISDPEIGRDIPLQPFGRDNVAAFARLLPASH